MVSCLGTEALNNYSNGTLRARWWNDYERGLLFSEKNDYGNAAISYKEAISKRADDKRGARTYGTHRMDYFPHRELGIVYYRTSEIDKAIEELQASISQEESAKAVYFLNQARRARLLMQRERPSLPVITLLTPVEGAAVNTFTVTVRGKVTGDGYVSMIHINDRPARFDLAKKEIEFREDIEVREGENVITIVSEDLAGSMSQKKISITVDREGPAVQIIDISPAEGNPDFVRVTGRVNDSTGLRRLTINDETIEIRDLKEHGFDIVVNKNTRAEISVHAVDSLDNETTAVLDLGRGPASSLSGQKDVLLAFLGTDMFSSDSTPPVIRLREGADLPEVYLNRYYIEGEVSDNLKVDRIYINDEEISAGGGKMVFFSKAVELKEGINTINVIAYDGSGNKTSLPLTVKRNIPSAMQNASRMILSVFPFDSTNGQSSRSQLAYMYLLGAFKDQNRFRIIDRTQLEHLMIEQRITAAQLTDPKYSIKLGRLMAAESIMSSVMHEDAKSIEVISMVLNTETSEIMDVKDVFSERQQSTDIKEMMDMLALKIARSFPVVDGMIIDKDGKYIYTDLESNKGIKEDMRVIFYRKGKELKHPLTGKSRGWNTIKLGEGRIEEVDSKISKATVDNKSSSRDIQVRDLVITK